MADRCFEKVAIAVEKLAGLAVDFRVNDEDFRKSKELYGWLKLLLKEAEKFPALVSVRAREWRYYASQLLNCTDWSKRCSVRCHRRGVCVGKIIGASVGDITERSTSATTGDRLGPFYTKCCLR